MNGIDATGIGVVIGAVILLSQIIVPLGMGVTQLVGKLFGKTIFKC